MGLLSKFKTRFISASLMDKANNQYEQGDYAKAVELLQKVLEIDPGRTKAYTNLGNAYEKLGQLQKAEEAHKKHIAGRPNDHLPWINLGVVYWQLNNPEQELYCYKKAIEINPKFWAGWMKVGLYHDRKEEHQLALLAYQQAVELNPKERLLWTYLSEVYNKLGQNELSIEAFMAENDLRQKAKVRKLDRVFVGLASGIICSLFLDWKWLFIIIGSYCFLESIRLFSIVRRSQLLKGELESEGRDLTEQEKAEIIGHATGYALPFALGQFLLSFILISIIGAITKWLIGLF